MPDKKISERIGKKLGIEVIMPKLWPHQREALSTIERYLKDFKRAEDGSALIRMPTGTGKSGVIAVLSQYSWQGSVLILEPWEAMRTQLRYEIGDDFWEKIGYGEAIQPKVVREFTPSTIEETLTQTKGKDAIFLCNIQTLNEIYANKNKDKKYNELRSRISLVIFDEGHREPAPEWGKAARSFNVPVVLLTATPYRNDHRMFNVNPNFMYIYPYQRALKENYIRDIKFQGLKWSSAEEFVSELVKFYNGPEFAAVKSQVKNSLGKEARVIVRCESGEAVRLIANLLNQTGVSAIGIHDIFCRSGFLYKNVPRPDKTDAIFWVHESKVMEGIDDPSFSLLGIYQPFNNARSVIQQIGRITRNAQCVPNQTVYVLNNIFDGTQKAFWENYLAYEYSFEENPPLYERRSRYDLSVNIQPNYWYIDGDFRKRIDIDSENVHEFFRFPFSANCYMATDNFSFDDLKEAIESEWERSDVEIRKITRPEVDTLFVAYVWAYNSPVLLKGSYIEFHLGFTVCKKVGKYIFFYDSNGLSSKYVSKTTKRLGPDILEGLFTNDGKINELSLMNSDLSSSSFRRRTIEAYSISEISPNLSDFYCFPTTSRGYTTFDSKFTRRYVGLSRGRITDSSSSDISYEEYCEWLKKIETALINIESNLNQPKSLSVFDRYAKFIEVSGNPEPLSILIDFGEALDYFETKHPEGQKGQPLDSPNLHCEILNRKFPFEANSVNYTIDINYDEKRKRYRLECRSLDLAYVPKENNPKIGNSIIGYLNREQCFRIVFDVPELVYAHSNFYKPNIPIGGVLSDGIDLLKILKPLKKLEEIKSEKGTAVVNYKGRSTWEENSLFGFIDRFDEYEELKELHKIDLLICDDMGREIADFIALDENNKRVILIHAKAEGPHKVSASALQTVFGQVKKNLAFLQPMNVQKPPNLALWSGQWSCNKVTGIVDNRVRKGTGEPEELWKRITKVVRDPSSTREVWVLLGDEFSYSEFEKKRNAKKPASEILQIEFLILSTWQAISEVGAKFSILCSS